MAELQTAEDNAVTEIRGVIPGNVPKENVRKRRASAQNAVGTSTVSTNNVSSTSRNTDSGVDERCRRAGKLGRIIFPPSFLIIFPLAIAQSYYINRANKCAIESSNKAKFLDRANRLGRIGACLGVFAQYYCIFSIITTLVFKLVPILAVLPLVDLIIAAIPLVLASVITLACRFTGEANKNYNEALETRKTKKEWFEIKDEMTQNNTNQGREKIRQEQLDYNQALLANQAANLRLNEASKKLESEIDSKAPFSLLCMHFARAKSVEWAGRKLENGIDQIAARI